MEKRGTKIKTLKRELELEGEAERRRRRRAGGGGRRELV